MLDTMPYADLLAIYNTLAEKPVTRFDTRANGVRRTEALLEARGLTLPEAARLADVVLGDAKSVQEEADQADAAARDALQGDDADPNQTDDDAGGHEGDPDVDGPDATIQVDTSIAPLVNAFMHELAKPERAPFVANFMRRLNGTLARSTETKRDRGSDRGYRPTAGPDSSAAAVARRATAERAAHRLLLEVDRLREAGVTSRRALARAFTEGGGPTPQGGDT
jgi:hypothetical protein